MAVVSLSHVIILQHPPIPASLSVACSLLVSPDLLSLETVGLAAGCDTLSQSQHRRDQSDLRPLWPALSQ